MDPLLGDAEFGLGLYNYYIDTLSSIAKVLRFFMGIPGGSKQAGIDQLERVIHRGVLTNDAARFYLAMNLCRYDRQYERALAVIAPLTEKYPGNPIFALVQGDFFAKLNRKEQAAASYRRVLNIEVKSKECRANIEMLVKQSLAVVRPEGDAAVSH